MFGKSVYTIGALAFLSGTHAHMKIATPTPYGKNSLQTSPIGTGDYNFPCQSGGGRTDAFEAEGASNPMTVGQDNDLTFEGTAVHGGGSCQLSVTYDYPPPADKSKWKVIHSYVGSCPASAAGNLASQVECTSDDQTECLKDFKYQIPEGMKNGNATLAWTWFNKIGNREMYMNCAPIEISGGSDDDTYFNSLPELFVANIPGECTFDPVTQVVGFPDPGEFVTYGEAVTTGHEGTCPSAGSSSGSSSSSTSAASSSATASSGGVGVGVSLSISLEQNGKTNAAVAQSTTMVTAASSSAVAAAATSAVSSYAPPAYSTAASASASIQTGSASNGTCESGKVSCTSPGNIMCIGDSQFGLCNIDYCAVPEALAAGTTCSSGVISKRDVVRRSSSRFHHRAAGHVHKHNF